MRVMSVWSAYLDKYLKALMSASMNLRWKFMVSALMPYKSAEARSLGGRICKR